MKKLILFELRKVFSKRLALIALIGIILFSALLSFSTFQNKYAFDPNIGEGTGKTAVEIDKEIAAKYEGILTDEKVQQMMSDFAPTSDLHGLSAIYVYQNAMQSAAFSRFSDKEGNWNGLSVSDVFGNEEIKIGYVDGWLSTSKNMVRFFIALALAVIIMLAPIFSGEYEGVDNIILTSKYGKTKCATAKVAAGILTAILTTALVAAFNLLLALIFYGTEGLDCSILFAPSDYVEGFISFNITCGTLLKYQILLAFTCTLSVTGITLFHLQGTFAFEILFCYDGDFSQGLRVTFHFEVQHNLCVACLDVIHPDVLVAHIADEQGIVARFYVYGVVPVQVGNDTLTGFGYLYGGSRQRFFGLSVGDCPFDGSRRGSHDGKCEE